MSRAAIYARYSSDRQRPSSIDDQVRLCRALAAREGWEIIAEHSDRETAGSTPLAMRPGAASLMAEAMDGAWQILILEGLDRLCRDLGEQERAVPRLEHQGIRIIGISDGYDSEHRGRLLMRGARGLVNALYLDDLRHKTHRGLAGRFAAGLSAGGCPYGYRAIAQGDGRGLEIDPEQARWIVWIFEQYAAGRSARAIAAALNRLGVPSPKGKTWAASAIYGHRAKGTGIVRNELYAGTWIWNRSRWVKDPDTGARKRLDRPPEEWQRRDAPELRIVPPDLWQAVRTREGTPRLHGGTQGKGGAPRTLLGGLLRCGDCGGPMVAVDRYRYGCSRHRERGTCPNAARVSRRDTERHVLDEIRTQLDDWDTFERHLRQIQRQARRGRSDAHTAAQARLGQLQREIGHLTAAIAEMGLSAALRERLSAAETERAALHAALETRPTVDLIPGLRRRWEALLADLGATLAEDLPRARTAIQGLMGRLDVVRDEDGVWLEMAGDCRGLLAAAGGQSLGVVAGARFCSQKRVLLCGQARE